MRTDLPEPTADERAHSDRLTALIRSEIAQAGGTIDFARYMELALYAPGLGYYSAGARKFGAGGDFVTAPELGFVFARCLARALAPVLRETQGDILELGPGSGALAADLLLELERLDALPRRYRLLERSADLRERQHAHLLQRCPGLAACAEWIDEPPVQPWRGALVGNEVLDALPVRLFGLRDGDVVTRGVGIGADGALAWRETGADAALQSAVMHALDGRRERLPLPYDSEVCTLLAPWFAAVAGRLEAGAAWFIDYGYPRDAYYAPERRGGTLRCHYRHRAHDDPLRWPGLQDITAWVDFDALAEAARAAGFEAGATVSQASFLVAHGLDVVFADAYQRCVHEQERFALAQEVKHLTLPAEMGEHFRVAVLRR